MSTSKKKRFDFFTEYHKEKTNKIASYIFSGFFAIFFAFSFIAFSQNGGDLKSLMASVAQLTPSPQYEADIILDGSGSSLRLIFGSDAKKVESINFILLSDPDRVASISSSDAHLSLVPLEGGMYQGRILMGGKDVVAGTILTNFSIQATSGAIINIIDTRFVSEGAEYSLTSKAQF